MAEEKKKYPKLAIKNWWALRNKFKERYPDAITNTYLGTVLGMTQGSARVSVRPQLKIIGLVDKEGNTTDLANKWRVDDKYAEVCKEIKEKIYPKELFDAVPDPVKEPGAAVSWFMTTAKEGKDIAAKMTAFYTLVSRADLGAEKELPVSPVRKKKGKPKKVDKGKKPPPGEGETPSEKPEGETPEFLPVPEIHIDLQIHISPEAKPEQIDKIFESLYKRYKEYFGPKKGK